MSRPRIIFSPRNVVAALLKFSLVALVLVVVSPGLRRRAAPVLAPVMNPVHRLSAGDRANTLARMVQKEIHRTGEAPQPRDLTTILRRMYPGRDDASLDPWGSRYFLRRRADGFNVGSPGPDRRRGTPDDVLSTSLPVPSRTQTASH
jgi:hypothetical protein